MSAALRVEVDDSPVYEVILSLFAFSRPQELLVDEPEGSTRHVASCSATLEEAVERLGGRYCQWDQLLGFAAQTSPPRSIARFLDAIAQAEPLDLLLHVLGYHAEPFPHHVRAAVADAAAGSGTARSAVVRTLCRDDQPRQAAMRRLLDLPLADVQELICVAVRRWYEEIFRHDEELVLPLLAADAGAKRALLTTAPELLIRITTGVRYVPKPWIECVLLIPTVVLDPWLLAANYKRTRIYCYAVADDGPNSPGMPPPATIRLYRALANATRLRVIKRLASCPMTADQLCRDLEVAEPELRPHLAILRDARLVGITCADQTTYEVREDLLATAGPALRAYLDVPEG